LIKEMGSEFHHIAECAAGEWRVSCRFR